MTEIVAREPIDRESATADARREELLSPLARPQSQLGLVWRGLRRDKFALLGGAIVLFTLFLALAAPVVAPHDPLKQNSKIRLSPIGTESHLLGTDGNGRDILSRLIYGSRMALLVATVPVLVSAVLGLAMGLAAGYVGGGSIRS